MPNEKPTSSSNRRIIVRAVPRAEPDLRRLARALIELARQEVEAEQSTAPERPSTDDGEAA